MDFISTGTTTEAASLIATENVGQGDICAAAICTQEAAEHYGLDVLAEDIGNDKFLQTRYILIHNNQGYAAERPPPMPHDKVLEMQNASRRHSAAFVLPNEPGALFKLLSCWGLRNINVGKIESRPIHAGMPKVVSQTSFLWEFFVYVEYEVPLTQSPKQQQMLWEALCELSLWQRDFGVYPSHLQRMKKEAQSWEDMVDLMTR